VKKQLVGLVALALAQTGCSDGYRGTLVDQDGQGLANWRWEVSVFCTHAVYGDRESYLERDDFSDEGETGIDGSFAFSVPSDVCESASVVATFTPVPFDGRSVSVTIPRHSVFLSEVPVWSPEITATDGAGDTTIRWTEVPADEATYSLMSTWLALFPEIEATEVTVDRRLLQDWPFPLSLTARASSSELSFRWTGGSVSLQGDQVPLSRGAACSALGPAGERVDFPAGACPVTDGSLEGGLYAVDLGWEVSEIIVDLGATTALDAITINGRGPCVPPPNPEVNPIAGCDFADLPYLQPNGPESGWDTASAFHLEQSDDCLSYEPLIEAPAARPTVFAAPGSGRCLRIRFTDETMKAVNEIGVW
jgi:hypothetical protein